MVPKPEASRQPEANSQKPLSAAPKRGAEKRSTISASPMAATLLQKVWDTHTVRKLPNGQTQLFIGLHLIHEVTTPQAFDMLRARGWHVRFPERTIGTVDHIVPTRDQRRPFLDVMAEDMFSALERKIGRASC